jgi:hypothetical protein
VINLIERMRIWATNAEEKQKITPKWQDSVVSVADVQKNIKEVNDKAFAVMNKPAPKPEKPAEPEKPADKEGEKPADTKMEE